MTKKEKKIQIFQIKTNFKNSFKLNLKKIYFYYYKFNIFWLPKF